MPRNKNRMKGSKLQLEIAAIVEKDNISYKDGFEKVTGLSHELLVEKQLKSTAGLTELSKKELVDTMVIYKKEKEEAEAAEAAKKVIPK
tara:strand:+ start:118 stop:384 length:267 start_codon:yes stop_codon:yes gene_type:complete